MGFMEREEARRERDLLLIKLEAENGASDSSVTAVLLFSIFVASCGSFVSGCGTGYTSPVESELMSDLDLTTAQFSLFGSLCTAGGLFGSIISGCITDYLGRKKTMGLTALVCLLGWLALAFSEGVWSLYSGRLLMGAGGGIMGYVIPIYIAEITPKNLRGGAVLSFMLVICCGIGLMFFVGVVVSWRVLALIACVPCIVQIITLPFIPESPRWLMKVGRVKEYEASLQRLRGDKVDITLEAAEIKEYTEALQSIHESGLFALFQRKYAYALTIGLGLMALGQFSGVMGIIYYASSIFESSGFSTTVGTLSMATIQIPVTAVGVFQMDRLGRRPLLLISASGMCLGCIFSGFSFLLKDHSWLTSISPILVFVGILLFVSAYPMGMGGIPYIIMSEIFPINVKGAAGSLAITVSCVTSWSVSYAFNSLLDWSSAGSFFIFAFVNALTCLFVFKLVPETKGRMLEEIQESITHALS